VSSKRIASAWLLVLLVPLLLLGFWWWAGGIRFSNPLPEMRSEVDRLVPPDGSTLVAVEETGLDRFCFLQCSTRAVEARFLLPDVSGAEKCTLVEQAMEAWLGVPVEVFDEVRGLVVCRLSADDVDRHSDWDFSADVFEGSTRQDGYDLSVWITSDR